MEKQDDDLVSNIERGISFEDYDEDLDFEGPIKGYFPIFSFPWFFDKYMYVVSPVKRVWRNFTENHFRSIRSARAKEGIYMYYLSGPILGDVKYTIEDDDHYFAAIDNKKKKETNFVRVKKEGGKYMEIDFPKLTFGMRIYELDSFELSMLPGKYGLKFKIFEVLQFDEFDKKINYEFTS